MKPKNKQIHKNNSFKMRKFKKLFLYSNPTQAQKMAYKYAGKTAKLYPSTNSKKKYDIFDPIHHKWIHFGQLGYEDFTKHHNLKRRKNYLTRSAKISGKWQNNKYSPNNLSRNILW